MRSGAALAVCLAVASCEAPAPPAPAPASTAGPMSAAAVVRVGDVSIGADQIARIAAAQKVSPAEARDLAVRDALFASEARARGLDASSDVEQQARALFARVLMQDIMTAAEAKGPVTDEELDEVTARRWVELDRPDAARTVHAVAMLKEGATADARAKAAALAEAIRKAISPAVEVAQRTEPQKDPKGPEDAANAAFRKAANEPPKGGIEVRVESLSPVVEDGRTLDGGTFDKAFARAALALARRGDVSPVFETPYGFHVALLLERIAGHSIPREERRRLVRDEVVTIRAHHAKESLLATVRPTASVSKSTDALLALVPVDR
jgi:hypothetical protein